MPNSIFQVTVTEELLSSALPNMHESVRMAAQKAYSDHLNNARWVSFALGIVLVPLSLLLVLGAIIHTVVPSDVPEWQGRCFAIIGAIAFPMGIALIVIFAKRREYTLPWLDGSVLQIWSINYSVRRLLDKVPFEVDYTLGKQEIEARIDVLEIHRRIPLDRVKSAYMCDYFCAIYTGYFQRLRWIYFETEEQRKNVEAHLRGVGLEIISLTPIIVAQVVH